ncbi:MAG: hypothetical protein LBQ16_00095 [Gracilibacteraceae bacterium]|jgi:hypothetical protein|nr:hypothetical protein [Gracilibacteraceae bacterium]
MKKVIIILLAAQFAVLLCLAAPLISRGILTPAPAAAWEWVWIDETGNVPHLAGNDAALNEKFNAMVPERQKELAASHPGDAVDFFYDIIRDDREFIIMEMTARVIDADTLQVKQFIADEFWIRPGEGLVAHTESNEFLKWAGEM